MLSAQFTPILDFLQKHHEKIEIVDSNGPSGLTFPDYKLTPYDYLEYARAELSVKTTAAKINCISHIKRAVECELDTLLHLVGIRSKRNFPSKMNFVRVARLISNKSLETFNRYRNKVEHDYDVPNLVDIDLYYDLAESFILALEGYIFMIKEFPGVILGVYDYTVPHIGVHCEPILGITLDKDKAIINFELKDNGTQQLITLSGKDFLLFAEALGILVLIIRSSSLISLEHVIEKLQSPINAKEAINNFA